MLLGSWKFSGRAQGDHGESGASHAHCTYLHKKRCAPGSDLLENTTQKLALFEYSVIDTPDMEVTTFITTAIDRYLAHRSALTLAPHTAMFPNIPQYLPRSSRLHTLQPSLSECNSHPQYCNGLLKTVTNIYMLRVTFLNAISSALPKGNVLRFDKLRYA